MTFRTPIRRKTRQRSGFNVAGKTPGSECKIKKSGRLVIKKNLFKISFLRKDVVVQPLFKNKKGILYFGAYIKPQCNLELNLNLKFNIKLSSQSVTRTMLVYANQWNKVGILLDIKLIKPIKISLIECNFKISSTTKEIGALDFFGINLGAIDYSYFIENKIEDIFYEKVNIYIPEISYQSYDHVIHINSNPPLKFSDGGPVVIKSCNRCSRFLPIDALNERNTLSFSNHCVKKVP